MSVFIPPVKIVAIDPTLVVPVTNVGGVGNPTIGSDLQVAGGVSYWAPGTTGTGTGNLLINMGSQAYTTGYYRVKIVFWLPTPTASPSNFMFGFGGTTTPTFASLYPYGANFSSTQQASLITAGAVTPLVGVALPAGASGKVYEETYVVLFSGLITTQNVLVISYSNSVAYSFIATATITPVV
jgi:hypothetical protein